MSLVNALRGVEGTAQAHATGAKVFFYVTSADWNAAMAAMAHEHNQLNGSHGAITTTSITNAGSYNQTSGTFAVPAGAITAPAIGTDSSYAWTAYTPTWTASTTNPTLGTGGTIVGAYTQIGKTIHARVLITTGTGVSAGSGYYLVSLPIAAKASYGSTNHIGTIYEIYLGSATYIGAVTISTANLVTASQPNGVSDTRLTGWSATSPTAPVVGSTFSLQMTYEAA